MPTSTTVNRKNTLHHRQNSYCGKKLKSFPMLFHWLFPGLPNENWSAIFVYAKSLSSNGWKNRLWTWVRSCRIQAWLYRTLPMPVFTVVLAFHSHVRSLREFYFQSAPHFTGRWIFSLLSFVFLRHYLLARSTRLGRLYSMPPNKHRIFLVGD